VTGQEMVGGHGDSRRGRRSRVGKSLRHGVMLGFLQSGACLLGVHRGGGDQREGRGKRILARWPRAPPLPIDTNWIRQGVDLDQDFLLAAKRMAGQVSLVSLFEKREEKRERLDG
jgi:hypothetical protein